MQLKPVAQQVIVITEASSSIGRVTARLAASRGARVVIGSRDGEALQQVAAEIERAGGEVAYATVDVGSREDMEHLAEIATNRFGRIDTWVNNAGALLHGRLEDTSLEEMRNLFETDFWGVVHGSLAAIGRLKRTGGALINVGSLVSDRAIPLQGACSVSKHAVKAYTDALRTELESEGAPVAVTLVRSAAIDTLFTRHAKRLVAGERSLTPSVHAPQAVARAILRAAAYPQREVHCGGAARMMGAVAQFTRSATSRHAPVLAAVGVVALATLLWKRRAPLRRLSRNLTSPAHGNC